MLPLPVWMSLVEMHARWIILAKFVVTVIAGLCSAPGLNCVVSLTRLYVSEVCFLALQCELFVENTCPWEAQQYIYGSCMLARQYFESKFEIVFTPGYREMLEKERACHR